MTSHYQNDSWSACQPGMLKQLAQQAGRRSRSRKMRLVSGGLAGLLVVTSGLLLWLQPSSESEQVDGMKNSPLGSIVHSQSANSIERWTCSQVLACCDEYLLEKIDESEQRQIRAHLGYCNHCEIAYRQRAAELQVEFSVLVLPQTPATYSLYAAR